MRGVALAGLGLALLAPSLAGRAQAQPSATEVPGPGFGQAVGQVLRVDPQAAGLSAGAEFAIAKATHQNRSSLATSQVFDPGLIGLIASQPTCSGGDPVWPEEDQPQPIRADSDDEHEASATDSGFSRHVTATEQPMAVAEILSDATSIPGLVAVGAARADAASGLVADGIRQAWSSVEIDGVDLLGGMVRLSRLRWESRHRGGLEEASDGAFTIGALEIGGTSVPVDNPVAAIDAVNAATGPFGIRLAAPAVHESGGRLFVDPLALIIEPSAQRDAVAGEVIRAAQPGREALLDAVIGLSCDVAGAITVLDVLAGSVTGAGRLSIELGGTEATTATIAAPARLGAPPGAFATPVSPGVLSSNAAPAGVAAPAAPQPAPIAAPAAPAAPPVATAAPVAALPVPEPGRDLAAAVGLATMLLGALLAEGDRRMMRRAQGAAATSTEEALP